MRQRERSENVYFPFGRILGVKTFLISLMQISRALIIIIFKAIIALVLATLTERSVWSEHTATTETFLCDGPHTREELISILPSI